MLIPNYQTINEEQRHCTLPENSLTDQVILITGATGGFGTALSKACAIAGATVVLISRKEKKLEKLYDVVASLGPEPALVPLEQDKAGPTEYIELTDMLQQEFGRVDALVHTSTDLGIPTPQMAIEHADWVRIMNVNLTSARLLSLYCMPLLSASSLASITFMLDNKPNAYWGSYGVSKQALHGFMHMLADETDGQLDANAYPRVAINGYDPGPMRTPLRRRAFPGELERETRPPEERLGPALSLLSRTDRSLSGVALTYSDSN